MNYRNVPMPLEEANAMVASYNLSGRTARAVRLFLSGVCESKRNAALVAGVCDTAVIRAVSRMESVTRRCDCCGHDLITLLPRPPKEDDDL